MSTTAPNSRFTPGAPRRIVVKGTSGAGKSTFGPELARRLNLPFIELDALHCGPDWSQPTPEEFQVRVRQAMAAALDGWVIDGNYDSKLGRMIVDEADTIIWLDLPLPLKLYRVLRRSLYRIRHKVELWHGNRETWRGVFLDRDSVIRWMIGTHFRHRRVWPARFGGDPRLVRLRSDGEMRRWLDEQSLPLDGAVRS
jgi:adenylate kinase family enzyme